jgi:leader peptidase (prepilin peptidase)/N-methyltransferase
VYDPYSTLVAGWFVLVGAVIGSFLNVVVARLPAGESVVRPRSRCPRCGTPIAWYDNVPVLSWLLLRARCRACKAPISARYPLVELLGGGGAWMAFTRHGLSLAAFVELAFVLALVTIALIDLDTWSVYRVISFPLIALGLAGGALGVAPSRTLSGSAIGAAVAFGALGLVAWGSTALFRRIGRIEVYEEAMGFGDVHILTAVGAFLGAPALLPVVLFASLQGSLVGGVLLLLGRSTRGLRDGGERVQPDGFAPPRHALPFGPFLALGAVEWLYLAGPLVGALPLLSPFR